MGGVLASIKNHLKIILPPILRYVYGSCGSDITHAPNTISPNHFTTSLTEHIRQRNTIIRRLHDIKTQHFKVIDFLGTFSSTSANFCIKGNALKLHTHWYNVHLTETGYKLGADTIIAEAKMLRSGWLHSQNPLPIVRAAMVPNHGSGAASSAPSATASLRAPTSSCTDP